MKYAEMTIQPVEFSERVEIDGVQFIPMYGVDSHWEDVRVLIPAVRVGLMLRASVAAVFGRTVTGTFAIPDEQPVRPPDRVIFGDN